MNFSKNFSPLSDEGFFRPFKLKHVKYTSILNTKIQGILLYEGSQITEHDADLMSLLDVMDKNIFKKDYIQKEVAVYYILYMAKYMYK